jgi:hypothetical protein
MRAGFILDVLSLPAWHSDTGLQATTLYQVETQTEHGRRFGFIVDTELDLNIGDDVQWNKWHLYLNITPNSMQPLWAEIETLEGPVRA